MNPDIYTSFFAGKRVTVMGLGLLGRSIGDIRFMYQCGAILTVTDKKTNEELASSIATLSECLGIEYRLGGHSMADFIHTDMVIKSASVPFDSEYIAAAQSAGVPVYMTTALAMDMVRTHLPGVLTVGVTGTRGKSTTTHMVEEILEAAGYRVVLGGNVRGVASLPNFATITDGDAFVCELDSWQLQGFNDLELSPQYSVFTSFMDDHMNYYRGDRALYFADKAAIFTHMREGDVCVVSKSVSDLAVKYGYNDELTLPEHPTHPTSLIGRHNEENAALASALCAKIGVAQEIIDDTLVHISAVEGRLEYIGLVQGVHVYNDNNGTTPDAVVAGIEAVKRTWGVKPFVICGGSDKGLDILKMQAALNSDASGVVYLAGTGTDTLIHDKADECETLQECVSRAFARVSSGGVILFSPGFASFSAHFRNEYEKNDEFVKCIEARKRSSV